MIRFTVWCLFLGVVSLVAIRVAGTGLAAPFAGVTVAAVWLADRGGVVWRRLFRRRSRVVTRVQAWTR